MKRSELSLFSVGKIKSYSSFYCTIVKHRGINLDMRLRIIFNDANNLLTKAYFLSMDTGQNFFMYMKVFLIAECENDKVYRCVFDNF